MLKEHNKRPKQWEQIHAVMKEDGTAICKMDAVPATTAWRGWGVREREMNGAAGEPTGGGLDGM